MTTIAPVGGVMASGTTSVSAVEPGAAAQQSHENCFRLIVLRVGSQNNV